MKTQQRQYRKDGFFNLVAPELPVLSEGVVADPYAATLPPVIVDPNSQIEPTPVPPAPPVFSDPVYEVDFYAMSCKEIKNAVEAITNILLTSRFGREQYEYYTAKKAQAESAMQSKCGGTGGGGTIDCLVPPCPPKQNTTLFPAGTAIPVVNVGPAGGGGGSSSGSGTAAAKNKNNNWLLIAALAALGLALYQTRNN